MVQQEADLILCTSASTVVREAPRLMDEQENLHAEKLERLRQDIRAGLDSGPAEDWNPDRIKRDGRARHQGNSGATKA
jgi:antitoxin ParD1/3/4